MTLTKPSRESALTGERKKSTIAARARTPGITASSCLLVFMCSFFILPGPVRDLVRAYNTTFAPIVEIAFSYNIHWLSLWN